MSFKYVAAIAAAVIFTLPAVSQSRLDRDELDARRAKMKHEEKPVWHYAVGTEQVGPLTQAELVAAAEAGTVKADTQVYSPDGGWRPASQVSELAAALE